AAQTAGSTPVVIQLANLNHHSTSGCSVSARCVTVRCRYTVVVGTASANVGMSDHNQAFSIVSPRNSVLPSSSVSDLPHGGRAATAGGRRRLHRLMGRESICCLRRRRGV